MTNKNSDKKLIIRRPMSIKIVSEWLLEKESFYLVIGNFLDKFKVAEKTMQEWMLEEEPLWLDDDIYRAYLASMAHKLAHDWEHKYIPDWVFKDIYFLPGNRPWFSVNTEGRLREKLLIFSPSQFKIRNLFVSPDVFFRI